MRIVKKGDGRVCQMVLWTERVRVRDLSGFKDIFQVFEQLVILSRSEESEEAASCLSEE